MNKEIEIQANISGLKTRMIDDSKIKVESKRSNGPRGDYYSYIIFSNGKISQIGEEQGNYAGGVCWDIDKNNHYTLYEEIDDLPDDLKIFIKLWQLDSKLDKDI